MGTCAYPFKDMDGASGRVNNGDQHWRGPSAGTKWIAPGGSADVRGGNGLTARVLGETGVRPLEPGNSA